MTEAVYPSILPRPSTEGYTISPRSNVKRTDMSTGAARHRRIYRDPPDQFTMTWDMNQTEFAVFEAFFNYELGAGVSWFEMYHWVGAGFVKGVFRFVNPSQPYSVSNIGSLSFKVTATLERRNKELISRGSYAILIDNGQRIQANVSRLHQLVNIDLVTGTGSLQW